MATAFLDPADEALDTTVRLVTPERITFRYPLAGPFRRASAYLIDLAVLLGLVLTISLLALALTLGRPAGGGLSLAILFVLRFGYGAICEGLLLNGQTPGKRALGLRVVSVEGVPISGAQAFLRNLLWCFDGLWPFAYIPALASMMLTRRFRRLGDLAAGTMVIAEHRPPKGRVATVEGSECEALLSRLPVRFGAGPELARALSDYVSHRDRFGPERREEMADRLASQVRHRYDLPTETSADAILLALYHRVFLEG